MPCQKVRATWFVPVADCLNLSGGRKKRFLGFRIKHFGYEVRKLRTLQEVLKSVFPNAFVTERKKTPEKRELRVSRKFPITARAGCCYGDSVFGNTNIQRKARYVSEPMGLDRNKHIGSGHSSIAYLIIVSVQSDLGTSLI